MLQAGADSLFLNHIAEEVEEIGRMPSKIIAGGLLGSHFSPALS